MRNTAFIVAGLAALGSLERLSGTPSGYVRNVKTEPAKEGKTRADFPSRQTYRAYLRELAKQGKTA